MQKEIFGYPQDPKDTVVLIGMYNILMVPMTILSQVDEFEEKDE